MGTTAPEPGREFFLILGQDFDATPGDLRVRKTKPVAKLRWTFRFEQAVKRSAAVPSGQKL